MKVNARIEWHIFILVLLVSSGLSLYGIVATDDSVRQPAGRAQAITQTIGHPSGIVVDGAGGFYISSQAQHRVYRVAADGSISLIAGIGAGGFSGDGGPATAAKLNDPSGMAFDSAGNLYIADASNNRIRKVTTAGIISTVAGYGASMGPSGDGGPAAAAQLFMPNSVAFDSEGNLYIADTGHSRIRKVTPAGIISTVVGNGIPGYSGDGGPATAAQLAMPSSVAFDSTGNLYIADRFNDRIRKVTPSGIINTIVGKETRGYSGDGGLATESQIRGAISIVIDSTGNLYICDQGNQRIRKVTTAGIISTIAGSGTIGFSGDNGPANAAQLNDPRGISIDSAGNLYIAEYQNHRIRKLTSSGIINTVAGNGNGGFIMPADPKSRTIEQPYIPSGAVEPQGNIYFDKRGSYRIRNVTKPIPPSERVVDNTRTPKAQNPGRIIIPKEIMTISGDGQGAYSFIIPDAPSVMPDGSLLIRVRPQDQPQLLLFDKDGRLLRDLMKEGDGHGEIKSIAGYFRTDKNIIIVTGDPDRLLWFNSAGKFEREVLLPFRVKGLSPLAFINGVFCFASSGGTANFDLRGDPRVVDDPRDVFMFTESSAALKPLTSFTVKLFFKGCQTHGESISCGGSSIEVLTTAPYQEKYLVVSHTGEYLLKIYDPVSNTIIREFRRDYDRIKRAPRRDDTTNLFGKMPDSPELKYENDVRKIFTSGDDIWVLTSTHDETKGVLIDLFDGSGVFKDSFYLKLPDPARQALENSSRWILDGNALYILLMRKNQDDTSVIKKYLIEK